MWYVSSNRDESRYDDPDRFDVERNPEHQAFGAGGRHFCLGAALARLELRILFEETLKRYPAMELAGAPQYAQNPFVNQMTTLPVRLTPRSALAPHSRHILRTTRAGRRASLAAMPAESHIDRLRDGKRATRASTGRAVAEARGTAARSRGRLSSRSSGATADVIDSWIAARPAPSRFIEESSPRATAFSLQRGGAWQRCLLVGPARSLCLRSAGALWGCAGLLGRARGRRLATGAAEPTSSSSSSPSPPTRSPPRTASP